MGAAAHWGQSDVAVGFNRVAMVVPTIITPPCITRRPYLLTVPRVRFE
jgi:hypothetical protein